MTSRLFPDDPPLFAHRPPRAPIAATPGPLDTVPASVRLALAAAGPVAMGAVLGARIASVSPVLALPVIVAGVTAVTAPALYIATAATGSAPSAQTMATAVVRALTALGVVLLGLAAPVAFLVATTTSVAAGVVVSSLALGAASLAGLSALHRALFAGQPGSLLRDGLFAAWAVVAMIIAGRLYLDLAVGVAS